MTWLATTFCFKLLPRAFYRHPFLF